MIITIIVMLILVGVTVNVALNEGLFESAEKANRDTEMKAIYEIIISASQYDKNGNINVEGTYNGAKQTLNSNGYKDVSDLAADGSLTVTGKNGKNKYKYKITKSKIEIVGLANENDSKVDPSVTYALVKEEIKEGKNVITAIYANQAQAYAFELNSALNQALINNDSSIPRIPTEGITEEEKEELEDLYGKGQESLNAYNEYNKNQTEDNGNNFLNVYSNYKTALNKYENTITIDNDCVINASNENTVFESIGDYVKLVGNVTFGDNITKVSAEAFYRNDTIKGITFSDSVTEIEERAFFECTAIESIKIPSSVVTIGDYAFARTAIKEIEIPSSVTSIGEGAFHGNENLTKILLNNDTTGNLMFNSCTALEEVTIPENIINMGGDEFSGCTNLKTINIENSIISNNEFFNTGIIEITLPGNVKTIGDWAFADCKSLKRVIIEDGVEEIYGAFIQETALDSITIPNSVTTLGTIISVKDVYYKGTVEKWQEINNDENYNNYYFYNNNTIIHMGDGTTYIYDESWQLVKNS